MQALRPDPNHPRSSKIYICELAALTFQNEAELMRQFYWFWKISSFAAHVDNLNSVTACTWYYLQLIGRNQDILR